MSKIFSFPRWAVGLCLLATSSAFVVYAQDAPATQVPKNEVPQKTAPFDFANYTDYYTDVQPILQRNCVSCHKVGGIAPFSLESYAAAKPMSSLIAWATQTRYMPPWMPSNRSPALKYERKLSDAEIQVLQDWDKAGALQGDLE
jgi:mono/diheme cytochrome c family protein